MTERKHNGALAVVEAMMDGWLVGLIACVAVGIIGTGIWLVYRDRAPAACVDTITIVSTIPGNPSAARCRPDQDMVTKDKMQGVVVYCTCRGESPP